MHRMPKKNLKKSLMHTKHYQTKRNAHNMINLGMRQRIPISMVEDSVVLAAEIHSGFEDIFDQFFGGGGRRASRNPNAPRQGEDLQYVMDLTFEEAIFGKSTTIRYNRKDVCKT